MCAYGTIYKSVGKADTNFILYSFLFIISSRSDKPQIYPHVSSCNPMVQNTCIFDFN